MTDNQDVAKALIHKVPAAAITVVVLLCGFGYFLTSTNLNAPLIKMLEATTIASNEQTDSVKKLSVDIRELAKVVSEGNKRIDTLESKTAKEIQSLDRRVTLVEDLTMKRNTESK